MDFQPTREFALQMDQSDPLSAYREQFFFPQHKGKDCLYFCGNSLGLQHEAVSAALTDELTQWKRYGVEGHTQGAMPWMYYHKFLQAQTAELVGANEEEVVVMNTLTTNLHLMMVSFYRPDSRRFKIIMEGGAFPSDQYAVESQVRFHGLDPASVIIEIEPREGEYTLRTEDILSVIEKEGSEVALVLFGGVNYYTGQYFDLQAIARASRNVGAVIGLDLAHAVGNLPLLLHDWGIDFAVWCSYKYLNSGPGGPGGVFVHERHRMNTSLPRFAGWWGHNEEERFQMKKGFIPMSGAAGWQLSNAQILSFASHRVNLDLFQEVGMQALRAKSILLTGYLFYLLSSIVPKELQFRIITPSSPDERGCQLSILTGKNGRQLFEYLEKQGVIVDWREPNVIRMAPVPLYNSFEDIWTFASLLKQFPQHN